jgi:alkanesulfonate monooxygenase SsuD/methylene tetrahydromethanopterin reductase-like flavin-dependent oxidoreductase (luciferase family)
VFGTVHVPLFPPVLAAKQIVTADHIGRGRFGLNLVCGWNQAEFDMFGLEQDAHDDESMEKLGVRPPGALPQAGDPGTIV